jgi:hypothetical protein
MCILSDMNNNSCINGFWGVVTVGSGLFLTSAAFAGFLLGIWGIWGDYLPVLRLIRRMDQSIFFIVNPALLQ